MSGATRQLEIQAPQTSPRLHSITRYYSPTDKCTKTSPRTSFYTRISPHLKTDIFINNPPLTMISLCSSRFFKKLENSRKEASVKRKASLFRGQIKGKPTKTSSLHTYAAFIIGLCISDELEFEVSEGVRELPLGCRETWKEIVSDHGRPCFQSRFSMNWFLIRRQSCGALLHMSCDKAQPSSSATGLGIPPGHSLGVCLRCSRMEQLLEKYLYCSQKHFPVLYSHRSERGQIQKFQLSPGAHHTW